VVYKILFTEDALSDLEVVLDYISADNPNAAVQFGTSLLNHVELLQSLPGLGLQYMVDPASIRFFILQYAFITGCTKIAD
jgi:plasmid stabilization system protein ParE